MKKGFTLIELLIVVAIIAILAAIAVPNFLEAQTRAKVSRVMSDMRTVNTALETYKIDHNVYPPHGIFPNGRNASGGLTVRSSSLNVIDPVVITTPIAYLNSEQPTIDIFQASLFNGTTPKTSFYDWTLGRIVYVSYDLNADTRRSLGASRYGLFRFSSAGPDQAIYNMNMPPEGTIQSRTAAGKIVPYDASNGTISAGDIFRTQKGELQQQYI